MQSIVKRIVVATGSYTYRILGDIARITFEPNPRATKHRAQCTSTTRAHAREHLRSVLASNTRVSPLKHTIDVCRNPLYTV